ncbi:MAG: hypothetical protein IT320_20885 [Anaerolineae bacterium]|nr:hypothetical protein [Anaerolineae bacterium]
MTTWLSLPDDEKTLWLARTQQQDALADRWRDMLLTHSSGNMYSPEVATMLFLARM